MHNLYRRIIQRLQTKKRIHVTSTTGMASAVLGFGASTVHHWLGIGDGRFTEEELRELYMADDRFSDSRKRVASADALIIDEIGMLSEKMFNKLELLCRLGRKSDLFFGGLQVTATL